MLLLWEVQRQILAACGACSLLLSATKSNCICRSTTLRIYKIVTGNILCYASATWTLSKKKEMAIGAFELKTVWRIYGPVHENAQWGILSIYEICGLYNGVYVATHYIWQTGMGWIHQEHQGKS